MGLPAHVLLVHFIVIFIVILAPLTAVLAILCAVWPAARRRLVWLVLGLAVFTAVCHRRRRRLMSGWSIAGDGRNYRTPTRNWETRFCTSPSRW
jgi:hypothetical protein